MELRSLHHKPPFIRESLALSLYSYSRYYKGRKQRLIMKKNFMKKVLLIIGTLFICGVDSIGEMALKYSTAGTLFVCGIIAVGIAISVHRSFKREERAYLKRRHY